MLSDGLEATLEPDEHGLVLVIDGIAQSHLGPPGAPPRHASHRWMLAAALAAVDGREVPAVLHLGGGALALPRAIADARPDARQRVVELEPALVELVAEAAPPPASVAVEVGDGRAALEAVREPLDVVAIDVFAAGRVPAPFTSVECFGAARRALAPGGTLVANSADGPPLAFLRSQLATLRAAFREVAIVTTGSTLAGARHSNVVLLASEAPLPLDAIRAQVRDGRPPAAALDWERLAPFVAETAPEVVRDATAVGSPAPVRSAYLGGSALPASLLGG
ncbi:fused MFS/spermidine synthase [Agrococcus terreus]|uniref:spermidine synthase n=1 Tax=Agrococcus terreus TaxID=574649 RepID=UPI00384D95FA